MAKMTKYQAKAKLDALGIEYDSKSSRDDLIDMLEMLGEVQHESDYSGPEATQQASNEQKRGRHQESSQTLEEVEVTIEKPKELEIVEDKPNVKRNKDGFIPGQPMTFEELMAYQRSKK